MGHQNGKGRFIDLNGRGLGADDQQDDITLEPGVIIIHCIMVPSTGQCQMNRDPRNPPPNSNQEVRTEMDNWLATLMYCLSILMVNCVRDFGVPREKMFETLNRTITGFFDRGMPTGEGGNKLVINTEKSSSLTKEDSAAIASAEKGFYPTKINWDAELIALGYNKLNDRTYVEYCTQTGLSDRDKSKTPISTEFYDSIVFRKALDINTFLEVARAKELVASPLDKTVSKYLVALVNIKPEYTSKHYWQITEPENTVEILKKIEGEATLIAQIYKTPTAQA